jgi:hypothetical protein
MCAEIDRDRVVTAEAQGAQRGKCREELRVSVVTLFGSLAKKIANHHPRRNTWEFPTAPMKFTK